MSGTLALTLRWGETDLAWVKENRLLVPLGLTGSLKISFWPDPLWLILTNYVAITIETDTPTPPSPPLPKKSRHRAVRLMFTECSVASAALTTGAAPHRWDAPRRRHRRLTCTDGRWFLRAACQSSGEVSWLYIFGARAGSERSSLPHTATTPPFCGG